MPPKNTLTKTTNTSVSSLSSLNTFVDRARAYGLMGHEATLEHVYNQLLYYEYGLHTSSEPAAVNILLGSTGSGKTMFVETMAHILHGDSSKLIRIDCAEFQHSHEIAKLVGSPPGYLGHRETKPRLTNEVLNGVTSPYSPISIVLFDEIEKGNQALTNLLLSVLDYGSLTNGDNSVVSFKKSMVFFTSNLGVKKNASIGFELSKVSVVSNPKATAENYFLPEFVNRIGVDNIHRFSQLSREELHNIVHKKLKDLSSALMNNVNCFIYSADTSLLDYILDGCDYQKYGGRGIVKFVKSKIVPTVLHFLNKNNISRDNKCSAMTGIRLSTSGKEIEVSFALANNK